MTPSEAQKIAVTVVDNIIADLSDRRGLQNEWDAIDEDIQYEITGVWKGLVVSELLHGDHTES